MSQRTRVIKQVALAIGVLYLLAAGVVLSVHASQALLIYLAVAGLLIFGSVYAMRFPERPPDEPGRGYWQMTGQRFRDPATGSTMEVRHNPVTGERDYVEVDEPS